jgi:hypothetical protein
VIDALPLFPLGTVLFPGVALLLHVFEPRYRALVSDLMTGPEPRMFGVVAIREGHEVGVESVRSLYDVGCVAVVRRVEALPDGRFAVMTVGGRRFHVDELDESRPYLQAHVSLLDESAGEAEAVDVLADKVRRAFVDYRTTLDSAELPVNLPDDPAELSYLVAATALISMRERQQLLEAMNTAQRLRVETDLLNRELGLMRTLRTVPITPPQLRRPSQN